eukprot:scaffold5537_cov112-Isochrysis_galbana.AAC.8
MDHSLSPHAHGPACVGASAKAAPHPRLAGAHTPARTPALQGGGQVVRQEGGAGAAVLARGAARGIRAGAAAARHFSRRLPTPVAHGVGAALVRLCRVLQAVGRAVQEAAAASGAHRVRHPRAHHQAALGAKAARLQGGDCRGLPADPEEPAAAAGALVPEERARG